MKENLCYSLVNPTQQLTQFLLHTEVGSCCEPLRIRC